MPVQYLIPAFIAFILVLAIPFFNGREFRLVLRLLLGLAIVVVPLAIAAMEARNIFEFFAIWFLVILAPFLWLFGGEAGRSGGGMIGGTETGVFGQILPWLPLVALGVLVAMVVVLKYLHLRGQRREE
ncbi:hypothetical protein [Pseudogemmobacter bohemicus]|uniref:hypothetical protein n=1 Tax=Pseudogemmobacter bohemicus TaxID=2250708 RepID=UPI000DD43676|nr:hypothetical protein [Pseudogemmobacter bohemicus]